MIDSPPLAGYLPAPSVKTIKAAALVLALCFVFFTWDIVADLSDDSGPLGTGAILHLSVETLSLAGLTFAIAVLLSYVRVLRQRGESLRQTVDLLRGDLGGVLARRFDDWKLTAAEREVAIMILKGAGVAEIAAARGTAAGTVKAQSSAIFRKTGVGSRAALMSVFLDEFLEADLSAAETKHAPAVPAS